MARCASKFVWLGLCLLVTGCGPQGHKAHQHTFVTESPEGDEAEPEEVAPLLQRDERETELPTYQIPEKVRERVNQEMPDFAPAPSEKFKVIKQTLKINVKTSTMTFNGILQIPGKPDEAIELQCKFDKTKEWICGDMFPTNADVAKERRLQGTVNCLDVYRCDQVGLELFVRINGSTESQLYQSSRFEIRQATSGDIDESLPKLPSPRPRRPRVQEKPTRLPPMQPPAAITDEQVNQLIENPNAAVEITAPMPVPPPTRGEFSIPDIEKLRPEIGSGVPNQAIGQHDGGRLSTPSQLPRQGPGFIARPGRAEKSYGTDLMIGLLTAASAQVEQVVPNKSPLVVSNISKKTGGRLCNGKSCHASHQTGLDVDVAFPSHKSVRDLWSACNSRGSNCVKGVSKDFDAQRFWLFAKQATCADKNPVIAIFVDTAIKEHMCDWARNQGENLSDPNSCAFKALRAMKYEPGHHNHFHMRLKCPGNRDCRNATVSLGRGTGC